MSITIRDCLKLPSLSLGRVIAGHKGLDAIVSTVSVLEFNDEAEEELLTPNELLISALYALRDDVDAQCRFLKRTKKNGDVGLVLFYTDKIMHNLDQRFLDMADLLNFPIIQMPSQDMGLKYSDIINDVMELVIYDKRVNNYFVNNTMERLSQTPESAQNPNLALKYASDYARASFFLCDIHYNIIYSSFWPATNYRDYEIFKSMLENEEQEKDNTSLLKMSFTEKSGNKLILCGLTHNEILSSTIMGEVVEVIQLLTILWNYNLNVSTREAVLPALINGNEDLVRYICQSNNINLSVFNTMLIVEPCKATADAEKSSMLSWIRNYFQYNRESVIADYFGSHLILIYHRQKHAKGTLLEDDLLGHLETLESIEHCTYCHNEGISEHVENIFQSYVKAIDAVRHIFPLRRKYTTADIRYGQKILDIMHSAGSEKQYYLQLLQPVINDREGCLIQTLSCYLLDADSELKTASDMLYVHRNTILYRLNKIQELLDCNLSKMPLAYEIYVAVSLYRLKPES